MRRPVVPFLTPTNANVVHGEWRMMTNAGEVVLPAELEHWDYQMTLNLTADLHVYRDALLSECHLGGSSRMEVLVFARSSRTNAEIVVARAVVPNLSVVNLRLSASLPGVELGGRLTLHTQLVVVEPYPIDRLAAQSAGSILWRTRHATELEGVGSQFPTDAVDFAAIKLEKDAGWFFRLDVSDPDARFLAAARLTLNASNANMKRMMAGEVGSEMDLLLRTLNWDVTRQMVYAALDCDDVGGLEQDPEAVSVSGVLRNLLAEIWPGVGFATLRRWQRDDPRRLEVAIQSRAKLVI